MSEPIDLLETTLKQHGKSLTMARRAVFKALQASETSTMAELVRRCQTIDRVSIYRTIELFEQLHIVQRLQIGWKYSLELSGAFAPHHHHASCERCGRIITLSEDSQIERHLQTLMQTIGFDMHDHLLEVRGLCRNCQSKMTTGHD